jgi:hypothetical protein
MEILNYEELSVNDLIDSILKIDNGYLDDWCESTNKSDYCENVRYNLLDELLRRYLKQKYIGENKELDRAYKLFLKFYV